MTKPIHTTKRARMLEMQKKALQLRIQGHPLDKIAEHLDVHPSTVCRAIYRALENTESEITQAAEKLRALQLTRLDTVLTVLSKPVSEGHLGAIREWRATIAETNRLLGLYPEKMEVSATINGPLTIRIIRED